MRYSIDNGPPPLDADSVDNYVGTAKVFPITATGQCFVLWISDYTPKTMPPWASSATPSTTACSTT